MNPCLAIACLILVAGGLLVLPLMPALVELGRKSDVSPLNVIQEHAGEIRYFAAGFRSYISGLEPALRQCVGSGARITGIMPDGARYLVLGRGQEALELPLREQDQLCPLVVAAGSDLVLPSETTFLREVYADGGLVGGERNNYRAILAEKDVHLACASSVTRWAHAVGEFHADRDCKLYGRISSDCRIRLGAGCAFKRLNAPRIEIGPAEIVVSEPKSETPIDKPWETTQRLMHVGDFEIRADEVFHGHLVVRGRLHVGSGARIHGSVKSEKDMVIGPGVSVNGSLVSAAKMQIGSDCSIHGPIIAEYEIFIERGTRCGSSDTPTTVSAPWIGVEEGVVVFGTLWAREQGQVVSKL